MGPATAVGIAILAGVLATALARRARRGPPAWVLGVSVASVVCLVVWVAQGGSVAISETDELYVASTTGAYAPQRLATVSRYSGVLWSPDSSEVLVHDMWGASDAAIICGVDGHARRALDLPEHSPAGAWSPDGEMVLCLDSSLYGKSRLLAVQADGSDNEEVIAEIEGGMQAFDWSPDGKRMAWITSFGKSRVEGVNADGTGRWSRSAPWDWTYDLRWTTAGDAVMVTVFEDHGKSIYLMEPGEEPSQPRRIARESSVINLAVSPDLRRQAYTMSFHRGQQVFVSNLDGTASKRVALSQDAKMIMEMVWSENSSTLLFPAYHGPHPDLWTVRSDGTGLSHVAHVTVAEPAEPRRSSGLEFLWRLGRRVFPWWIGPVPSAGLMGETITYGTVRGVALSPDSAHVTYMNHTPKAAMAEMLQRIAGLVGGAFILLGGPLAFVWGIVAWRRQGRSVTTMVCVILGLPITLASVAYVVVLSLPM